MHTSDSYRSLNPDADWPFFDADFGITPEVSSCVRPLDEKAAVAFWVAHVSSNSVERHPMLLPEKHWLSPTEFGPNWVTEFNENVAATSPDKGAVSMALQEHFGGTDLEPVFFVTMRERAYSLEARALAYCWPCLLAMDDEGAFLYQPGTGLYAWFGPNGTLGFGSRPQQNVQSGVHDAV
jgi:hypothetical protein